MFRARGVANDAAQVPCLSWALATKPLVGRVIERPDAATALAKAAMAFVPDYTLQPLTPVHRGPYHGLERFSLRAFTLYYRNATDS
jgi:hypothetical protein